MNSKTVLCAALFSALQCISGAQAQSNLPPTTKLVDPLNEKADTAWFEEARFGMFIHFGLYSVAGRHEWVKSREKISDADYQKYFDNFNPDLFDAKAWARSAKNAGMKYVVLTTRHHEGFSLFETKMSDYKVTNTPFKRDIVKEFVDAVRAEGLKVGFYYSLLDWYHPEYTVDRFHPMRDNEEFKKAAANRDMKKYAAFLRGQMRELLTKYGKIDYLWFDYSFPKPDGKYDQGKGHKEWESEELVKLIRQLQPNVIINDRLNLTGGVSTPEQFQPKFDGISTTRKLVEECNTFNGSWGYHRDNLEWKSPEMLVQLLVDAASKGNNLLLNVGPTGRGNFEDLAVDRLNKLGDWMKLNGRSIYGTVPSAFTPPSGTRYTQKGNRLYLHLSHYPIANLELPGLAGKIKYAQFLHDGSELQVKEFTDNTWGHTQIGKDSARLNLPMVKPNIISPVVELILK